MKASVESVQRKIVKEIAGKLVHLLFAIAYGAEAIIKSSIEDLLFAYHIMIISGFSTSEDHNENKTHS